MSIPDLLEGLNCCSGNVNSRDCDSCPYFKERRCLDKLLEHAAEVIQQYEGDEYDGCS